MKQPVTFRKGIPFFHQKTAQEFQQDVYERYDDMVVRQSALHLADNLWGLYPFQPILDFAQKHYPTDPDINILEVGCGVGRWIGILAKLYPAANLWGIDFSYQMLKRANEFWVHGNKITIDLKNKGWTPQSVKGQQLNNLNFGLAKAELLPFDSNSQDLVVNSFLIDRLENTRIGIEELYRVLKPDGQVIGVTPLNFNKEEHWKMYYPETQLLNLMKEIGFEIVDWKEGIVINEPLDFHGNGVRWNCIGFVLRKGRND